MNNSTTQIFNRKSIKVSNLYTWICIFLAYMLFNTFSLHAQVVFSLNGTIVNSPVGYGDTLFIPEIIIAEGDTNDFYTSPLNKQHKIELAAPGIDGL